jgi:hypothetical protein
MTPAGGLPDHSRRVSGLSAHDEFVPERDVRRVRDGVTRREVELVGDVVEEVVAVVDDVGLADRENRAARWSAQRVGIGGCRSG